MVQLRVVFWYDALLMVDWFATFRRNIVLSSSVVKQFSSSSINHTGPGHRVPESWTVSEPNGGISAS